MNVTTTAFYENFELGTRGLFDAETDTGSLLDFPHYTELARAGQAPYRGAYCMRLKLAGATDAYVQENGSFDFAANEVRNTGWMIYLGKDFAMADTNKLALFNLESVADTTVIVAAGLDRSGSNIRAWFANTNTSSAQTVTLGTTTTAVGKWYHLELRIDVDAGGGDDGTIDGYLNGVAFGSQITALDQGASVDAKFGAIGVDAGTSGTLLFDQIIATTDGGGQLYPFRGQYKTRNRWVIAAQDHPIIGPAGEFSAGVTGTGGTGNCVLTLYDTDGVPNGLEPLAILRNTAANEFIPGHDVFQVSHGLYCTLSGTNAQAFFSINRGGLWSDATIVNYGLKKGNVSP